MSILAIQTEDDESPVVAVDQNLEAAEATAEENGAGDIGNILTAHSAEFYEDLEQRVQNGEFPSLSNTSMGYIGEKGRKGIHTTFTGSY